MPQARSVTVGYYIAVTLLVIGLVIGALLLTRVAGSPGGLEIGTPFALACETGEGSPSCFGFSVRNSSDSTIVAECIVVPAELTDAGFADGGSTVDLTLPPDEEQVLRTSVDIAGGDVVTAPELRCTPQEPSST